MLVHSSGSSAYSHSYRIMSRTLPEKVEIVGRWFRDNIFDRAACRPQLPDFTLPPLSSPPSHTSPSPADTIRVFSYNTWGLPIAPLCTQRVTHLSTLFHAYDVLCLQEMSTNRDVHSVVALARAHGLTHAHQFRQGVGFPVWNGVTAPGLLVLSRFPIVEVALLRYRVNGLLYRFDHSDWVAGKGVGLVRVDVTERSTQWRPGDERVVADVFVTHLVANYSNFYHHYATNYSAALTSALPLSAACPDFYLSHRVAQAFELARFYLTNRHPTRMALMCGDFNAAPYDIVLHLIQAMTGLRDAWVDEGGADAGYTCGAHDNTYSRYAEAVARGESVAEVTRRHGVDKRANGAGATEGDSGESEELYETPKRIDYILYSTPTHSTVSPTASSLPCIPSASTPLANSALSPVSLTACQVVKPTMRDDSGRTVSLSDHHAVSATFSLTSQPRARQLAGVTLDLSPRPTAGRRLEQKEAAQPTQQPPLSAVLTVAMRIVQAGVAHTQARREMQWIAAAFAVLLFVILTYTSLVTPRGLIATSLTALLHYPLTLFSRPLTLMSSLVSSSTPAPPTHPVALAVVQLVLAVCATVRWSLPFVALLVFLLAQFPAKEESIALMETLQEMKLYLAYVKRAEDEQEWAARNKRKLQPPSAVQT